MRRSSCRWPDEFTSGGSEDILEAVKAFKEKRKPVYHNR
jgi:hypothetical protein